MQQNTANARQKAHVKLDEKILVVPRADIISDSPWTGIKKTDIDAVVATIQEKKQFLWRSEMEHDPSYKQIIPYLVFSHNGRFFLMQRKKTASETRLQSKYSLGIGGHIREEDIQSTSLFNWAKREFNEEVNYNGSITIKTLGVLNDDTNEVGKVHLGLVLLIEGDSSDISVRSELQSGNLVTLSECSQYKDSLESWSQFVLELLLSF